MLTNSIIWFPKIFDSESKLQIKHGNLKWLSGVDFLVKLVHFFEINSMFSSMYLMIVIKRAPHSPDIKACFKYLQFIHSMHRKFFRTLWSWHTALKSWLQLEHYTVVSSEEGLNCSFFQSEVFFANIVWSTCRITLIFSRGQSMVLANLPNTLNMVIRSVEFF